MSTLASAWRRLQTEHHVTLGPTPSPVIAVDFEDRSQAIDCWKSLMESGVYVNLVIPPASPSSNFLLRNSVSAAHSTEQIDTIIAAYRTLIENGTLKPGKTI